MALVAEESMPYDEGCHVSDQIYAVFTSSVTCGVPY